MILRAAWESVNDRFPISFDDFKKAVAEWEINPVYVDGLPAGALMVNGPDIHACVLPFAHGRWLGKKQLRILNRVIEKHGFAQTKATTKAGEYFVKRLGFVEYGNSFRRTQKWAWNQS